MNENHSNLSDRIWEHIRRVILRVVYDILGPPPPDVTEKIEDVIRQAKQDWDKGERECPDETEEML
jgi:hypothetical protein